MSEAMRQVKDALGDDAIIVSTKDEGGWVRITAAVEQINATQEKKKTVFDDDTVIEIITDTLLKHRVPASVSDRIIFAAASETEGDPKAALVRALKKTFAFKPAPTKKSSKPLLLAGPPGAGKTLMTAKLAAKSVLNGGRPAIITTDIARAGGLEQLQAFLDILSLPLLQADDVKSLKTVLAMTKSASEVIIDTGGLNPFDPQEMRTLAKLMSVEDMETALVLPAGMDAEESAEMAMTFEVLGITSLMPTRLDFARRLGGILSAADRAKLAFTQGSHTPQVAEGLLLLTPETMADLLMPVVPKTDKGKRGRK